MKTRSQRTYLEASIIGDSHAMAVWKHLAPAVAFRYTMTAPAKHFDGRFFSTASGRLNITAEHLREAFPRASDETIHVMTMARERLNAQLQLVIDAGLPVISSLGSASYRFARRVAATGEDFLSGKIMRAAASDHIENFVAFHKELVKFAPSTTFMLGACRYPVEQKAAWLAYDQILTERMNDIGVNVIDVRAETGDEELKLLPEFAAADILHGNDCWARTVADHIYQAVGQSPQPVLAPEAAPPQ